MVGFPTFPASSSQPSATNLAKLSSWLHLLGLLVSFSCSDLDIYLISSETDHQSCSRANLYPSYYSLCLIGLDPNVGPKNKAGLLAASFMTGTFGAAFMLLLAWNASWVISHIFDPDADLPQKHRRPHQESHHQCFDTCLLWNRKHSWYTDLPSEVSPRLYTRQNQYYRYTWGTLFRHLDTEMTQWHSE
jgi:hypothetical protein